MIEPSSLGIVVDGQDLGDGAAITRAENYRVDEKYPWRGVHSEAVNRANGTRLRVRHTASKTEYTLDVRASDDSAAVRFIVPGEGSRVPDAGTSFTLPAGTIVWSHGLGDHYEPCTTVDASRTFPMRTGQRRRSRSSSPAIRAMRRSRKPTSVTTRAWRSGRRPARSTTNVWDTVIRQLPVQAAIRR